MFSWWNSNYKPLSTGERRYQINSSNPKIYSLLVSELSSGNENAKSIVKYMEYNHVHIGKCEIVVIDDDGTYLHVDIAGRDGRRDFILKLICPGYDRYYK